MLTLQYFDLSDVYKRSGLKRFKTTSILSFIIQSFREKYLKFIATSEPIAENFIGYQQISLHSSRKKSQYAQLS